MKTTRPSPQELIEEGQGLVHSLATKIHRNIPVRVDYDDLVAYGELGLAEAARDFDPEQGTRFTTFAYYRVRGAIYDGLSKMSWTSRARYRRFRYEQMAGEVLARESQSMPQAAGNALEIEAAWFGGIAEKLGVVYLASQGDEGGVRESTITDPRASAPTLVAQNEVIQKLREMVSGLPGVEGKLIEMVYFEDRTLKQAADRLGLSKSWASRVHARALEQLARSLRRMGVTGH